ncbi:MAG: FAD:protein FMN transferase [Aquificota bacterium]|nr:FAD:protein FMN transferase [Aquificota bacterium]MDQ7082145.1 FAD:protein FMN transferase [Aquificota bacterium]
MFRVVLFLLLINHALFSVERVFYLMGTYAVIDLPVESEVYRTYLFMRSLEEKLSPFIEDSEISTLNRSAGKGPVRVSEETAEMIRKALYAYEKTYGYFDITRGAGGPSSIRLNGSSVYLSDGTSIDIGGIGKGYTVEKAYLYAGTEWGFVSIAGDMKVWGHRRVLAVRDPRGEGPIMQMVNSRDLCLSTSGNYIKRHIEQKDRDLLQITVVHTDCTLADAYATALFSMPRELRRRFYAENPEVGALEVFRDGSLYMNRAFPEYFEVILIKKR